jgi:hypothetical protein
MTPLAQADLKGTYDQAYEDTKELINQDQGNTLDWFLQQEKTYNSATAVAKTKDLEKNTTDDAVTIAKFDAATPTE